ncbi:MAG: succinate dehydrogenase cytochrome b subunit [Oscillatoria sp. SIO1A7]|nr:succinate dehydrogenase cytochrome b subunit [Oscillatoria sp. SIO1A7]
MHAVEIPLLPSSSIAKKAVMAITGLLVIGFLAIHFIGNLLLFAGPQAYNQYAHKLASNPLFYLAEAGLLLSFAYHIISGFLVWSRNRAARSEGYQIQKRLGKGTFMSKTLMISGIVILAFLILHLVSFKFGEYIPSAENPDIRDLYSLVVAKFHISWYVFTYIACIAVMGLHLSHGFQSAFRTLGLSNDRTLELLRWTSYGLAAFFVLGYSAFPLYFFLSANQ